MERRDRKFGAKSLREEIRYKLAVLISYETPVAVFDGHAIYRTDRKFSVTTSRHVNFYIKTLVKECGDIEVKTVPHSTITDAAERGFLEQ